MLVLSRKKNQTIVIDGNVEIQVLQVKGNSIRLGISAPRDVRVLRGELKPLGAPAVAESTGTVLPAIQSLTAKAG